MTVVRGSVSEIISVDSYGAKGDGSTDNSPFFDDLTAAVEANITDFAPGQENSFGLFAGSITVRFLPGVYNISSTLIFLPGVTYQFDAGAVLRATTQNMDMVRTYDTNELQARGWATSSNKNLKVVGNGIIDGNDLANCGLDLVSVAQDSEIDVQVIRCTSSKFSTTASQGGADDIITVPDGSLFTVGDILDIGNTRGIYAVWAVNGNEITLDNDIYAAPLVASSTVTNLGVGVRGRWVQQSDFSCLSQYNKLNYYFGRWNSGGSNTLSCTNNTFRDQGSEDADYGFVLADGTGNTFLGGRFQHSFSGPEMILMNGDANYFYGVFIEPAKDDELNIPETEMRLKPLIDVLDSKNNYFDIIWPPKAGTVTFRRLMRNSGDNTKAAVRTTPTTLNENPDLAGDVAPFLQDQGSGSIYVHDVSGPLNITDPYEVVIDTTDSNFRSGRITVDIIDGGQRKRQNRDEYFNENVSDAFFDGWVAGDSFSRFRARPDGLRIGDGTSSPVQIIGAQQPAISDASGGGTTDAEARAAINALLAALRVHGLIDT